MTPFLRAAVLALVAAGPVHAEQTTILSPCLDGPAGAVTTEADLAGALAGEWRMVAAGTGMTTGTNSLPVSLWVQPGTGALMIGAQGEGTVLNVLRVDTDAQGRERNDAPFDLTIEDLSPAHLPADEVEVLLGCASPLRYWWQVGSGSQRSWGALMFYDTDRAVGFMANSAGGSRSVMLQR